MEKLKTSLVAKAIAMVMVIACLALSLASFVGMLAMDEVGGYQIKKEDMLEKGFDKMCQNYSIVAMAGYEGDFNKEELSETNFRYGVVKADDIGQVDFSDPNSYIAGNFEEIPDVKELHFEEYDIGEGIRFVYGDSILDAYSMPGNSHFEMKEYEADGYLYDRKTQAFYVRSGKKLFPLQNMDGVIATADGGKERLQDAIFFLEKTEALEDKAIYTYSWREEYQQLMYYDSVVGEMAIVAQMEDVQIVDGKLEQFGKVADDGVGAFLGNRSFVVCQKAAHYIVASYANLPLAGEQTLKDGDLFVQIQLVIDFAYRMRYTGIAVLVLSLILLFASFAFLMAAAGHRKGREGISQGFLDYVPLDLYFAFVCLAEAAFVWMAIASLERANNWSGNASVGIVSAIVISTCAATAGVLVGVAYCMSFAVRVKLGKWWRHTLVYIILRKILRLALRILRFCGYLLANLLHSITLLWKAWLALIILAVVELFTMQACYFSHEFVRFWLLEKVVLYPLIIMALLQMDKLQKGARRIADGELDYQVDTRHMFWEIKKHGEYLNDIGDGINSAVNERMKSERFKTELITNVSHDIKTPLTSIINYVDLLQKEEIGNPTVQEYLEVLHRQSARLKKLIEDLMEASKASTGSLSVVMEKCDAGVMLVQTVGEFEEKLMENQIELQVKRPDADIFIEADHRHLWRVFDNLMNNICKYAQPSTRAYINLEQNGQQALVTFRNISKCQLNISSEELMERFVRGDSSRNTEGSGLGISIAKSLTELMDGAFELIVDGDLFKVVLAFPLYGTVRAHKNELAKKPGFDASGIGIIKGIDKGMDIDAKTKDSRVLQALAVGMQNAGAHAANFRHGMAGKAGRMVWRAGRLAHHVRQAAKQVKEEEARMDGKEDEAEYFDH